MNSDTDEVILDVLRDDTSIDISICDEDWKIFTNCMTEHIQKIKQLESIKGILREIDALIEMKYMEYANIIRKSYLLLILHLMCGNKRSLIETVANECDIQLKISLYKNNLYFIKNNPI